MKKQPAAAPPVADPENSPPTIRDRYGLIEVCAFGEDQGGGRYHHIQIGRIDTDELLGEAATIAEAERFALRHMVADYAAVLRKRLDYLVESYACEDTGDLCGRLELAIRGILDGDDR